MARNKPFFLSPQAENTGSPLFVEALAKAGVIPVNKFSFYFGQIGEQSWVDFGEPNLVNIRDGAPVEIKLNEDFFWSGFCQGVAIGDLDGANTYRWQANKKYETVKKNSIYTIMDTGTRGLMISKDYYDSLIYLIKLYMLENNFASILTKCEKYPTLWFMFDLRWVEISAKDYVV